MIDLKSIQKEINKWNKRNFPNNTTEDCLIGVGEEFGELCHATLKRKQGIRGTDLEHSKDQFDAVGDIIVFLSQFCNFLGFDLEEVIKNTWRQVRERDWTRKMEADHDIEREAKEME